MNLIINISFTLYMLEIRTIILLIIIFLINKSLLFIYFLIVCLLTYNNCSKIIIKLYKKTILFGNFYKKIIITHSKMQEY